MKSSASVLLLLAAVAALYRKTARLWWTYDDAFHLHVSLTRSWTDAFTAGDLWPQRLFTPLLLATHEALLAIAGLDAEVWYAVSLALIGACAVMLFAALRLYVDTVPALCAALLFAAGPPICSLATQLMAIHYLEAIFLGTLAVIAWLLAMRRRALWLELASAVLYFLAMLAKEVAVPLPALLFALPEREPRVRVRHLTLHGIALAVYFLWRRRIIGTFLGGYGWAVTRDELPRLIATLPWKVILTCAGASVGIGLTAVALVSTGALRALRTRRALIAGLVLLVLAVAPILPVSKEMQPRYVVMFWLWACVMFAVGVASIWSAAWRNALIAAAVIAVVVANRQEWTREYGRSIRMSGEARAFMALTEADLLRRPAIPPAAMRELQWLKEQHLGRARGTSWFYDDVLLCSASSLQGKRVYEWTASRREVMDITPRLDEEARRFCGSIRENVPLRAEFRHRDQSLFWSFGPYEDGRWSVILANGLQAFPVPAEDGFRLDGVPGLTLRVRYESPEGWITYSPDITIDFARQPNLVWQR